MESLLALNVRNARLLPESELDTLNVIITIANFLSGNAVYLQEESTGIFQGWYKRPFRPSSPKLNLVIPEIRECVINCLEARAEIRMQ